MGAYYKKYQGEHLSINQHQCYIRTYLSSAVNCLRSSVNMCQSPFNLNHSCQPSRDTDYPGQSRDLTDFEGVSRDPRIALLCPGIPCIGGIATTVTYKSHFYHEIDMLVFTFISLRINSIHVDWKSVRERKVN